MVAKSHPLLIADLMEASGVRFGTSGARGLAEDMTDRVCYAYTAGFLHYLREQGYIDPSCRVGIAGDLRPSSDRIANACAQAALDLGHRPVNLGKLPTPALTNYGIRQGVPTLMVTGSHIPDDRNGIKFNTPDVLQAGPRWWCRTIRSQSPPAGGGCRPRPASISLRRAC